MFKQGEPHHFYKPSSEIGIDTKKQTIFQQVKEILMMIDNQRMHVRRDMNEEAMNLIRYKMHIIYPQKLFQLWMKYTTLNNGMGLEERKKT